MRRLPLLTLAAAPLPCRTDTHACVACCRGPRVPESVITAALHRNTRLWARWAGRRSPPGRLTLVAHELRARRGLDLVLLLVFLVPGVGGWVRPWVRDRLWCAFLGFDGDAGDRPGCLLHPTRWAGEDHRQRAAFALLPGLGCGDPSYVCPAALGYRVAAWPDRQRFRDRTANLGWYAYSRAVEASGNMFSGGRPVAGGRY